MSPATLWRNASFLRLYTSTLSFSLGTQVYQLAMPLVLYELTRSASTMTAMRAVELLPNLLLAMFIGVWVDRIDRGRWAKLAILGMVVLLGLQAWMLEWGARALPYFFVVAFVLMAMNYLFAICRMGMLKEILPAPLLLPATSQLAVLGEVFSVLGPALAGAVLAWRLEAGFWIPMLAMLLAAWLLRDLNLPPRKVEAGGFWHEWRAGWKTLIANRPLWQLTWLVVLINGSTGVAEVLFLFRARDELHMQPGDIGMFYAMAGVGGIVGGLLCNRLRQRWGLGRLMALELLLESACIAVLALSSRLPLLLIALTGKNLGSVIGNVCVWGYRQETTDSAFIGRISGITGSMFKLLMPAALVLSGSLSHGMPLAWILGACAVAHLLAALGTRVSLVYRAA